MAVGRNGCREMNLPDGVGKKSKRIGRGALSFSLPDTAGKMHRLEDYAGNWLLMVFLRHLG